jgi:nucleoside-diphosphate-sugar epimerase
MKVLVAGGAGFLGSHLCDALIQRGHEVVCLDNFITGRPENVQHLERHPRFAIVRDDVTRAPLLSVDLIMHLASPASPVHYRQFPVQTMLANSAGTHRLLASAADVGARFILTSTSEVYGDPLEHPQRETYWGNVDPIGLRACYDESKRFGEAITWEYRRVHGVRAAIVRPFNTYGPRMNVDDGRVVPAFIAAALRGDPMTVFGDGTQTRSFCYVDDFIRGLIHVAEDPDADGQVLNIGNPHEITMLELAAAVSVAAGVHCRTERTSASAGDPARRRPDISRMRDRYGWSPRVSLEDGLEATLAYVREELCAPALVEAA